MKRPKLARKSRKKIVKPPISGRRIRPLSKTFLGQQKLREQYKGKTVIFISPHPDDAEISAGATLHALRKAGANVINIIMTTGNNATIMRNGKKVSAEEVAKIRRKESENATRKLGINRISIGEAQLRGRQRYSQGNESSLIGTILSVEPDVIFVTNPLAKGSDHPDHTRTLDLTNAAIGKLARKKSVEVWSAESPYAPLADFNTFVEVGEDSFKTKLRAINAHRSQVNRMPYARLVRNWNDARGMLASELKGGLGNMGEKVKHVEAFNVLSGTKYLAHLRNSGVRVAKLR